MPPGDAGRGGCHPASCGVQPCDDQIADNNNVALLPRRPMQLEFKNITYTVSNFSVAKMKFVPKMILKGVDGCFRPGELTAIMGPSGAGKSTLLNILAGYVTRGAGGSVSLNGTRQPAARSGGRGSARFIRQIDELRQYLTVAEAGLFLAALRLAGLSALERREKVYETLAMLGLSSASQTLSRDLSGGQRRRLAVALELLSDPSILFLDEPTTGLDSASSAQLIALLSRLARGGRTLVATIHQPSALLFERLDAVHCLAEGRTLYRGARQHMMPALANAGLRCPPYHNPADFLMEVASGDYNIDLVKLSETISQDCSVHGDTSDNNANTVKAVLNTECDTKKLVNKMKADKNTEYSSGYRQAGLCMQTWLLLYRSFLMTSRNYNLFLWRFFAHICIGFLFGYLYKGVGATADQMLGNYVYLYGSMLFVCYTGKMAVTLCFPLEVEILKGEHFNRWYKLGPYIISILAVELPFQVLCSVAYFIPSFWLTANLPEFHRMALFLISISLSSLCAQAWGYFIGATTPVKIAVFVGPVLICLQSVFGFCLSLRDTPLAFRWLHHVSFFRAGFHVVVHSVFGLNRDKMPCQQTHSDLNYCHYAFPSKFLKEMDVLDIDILGNLVLVGATIVVMHILASIAIWWKLNKR